MEVNIQGVERDLQRIEQIDSRLYNNKDTQRVIQELGSTQTNNNNFANFVSSTVSSSMLIITNRTTS